jgi:quercetin dioxygenase-like cupin family protein
MSNDQFPHRIRRVVTGHDAEGRSCVRSDAPAENRSRKDPLAVATTLWTTAATPAPFLDEADGAAGVSGLPPPIDGTRFGVLDLAPGRTAPGLHRTDTIDYVVCVLGEVTLTLDEGEVILRPGDVVVQGGAAHGWSNLGSEPARIAFVLIDGHPKRG